MNRIEKLKPGGIPRWIRVYDNGGGFTRFCRKCLRYSDDAVCGFIVFPDPNPSSEGGFVACGHPTVSVPEDDGSFDRYTVVFTGRHPGRGRSTFYLSMSMRPQHPQGYGYHGESDSRIDVDEWGFPPKVGDPCVFGARRITYVQLPEECQRLVADDYDIIWGLPVSEERFLRVTRRRDDLLRAALESDL